MEIDNEDVFKMFFLVNRSVEKCFYQFDKLEQQFFTDLGWKTKINASLSQLQINVLLLTNY